MKASTYRPLVLLLSILQYACATTIPASMAELNSGFTYVPVDPFSVKTTVINAPNQNTSTQHLLTCLPDNTVRMSAEQFDSKGNVSYGPATVSAEGSSYRVTVDYTSSDTVNLQVWVAKKAEYYVEKSDSSERRYDFVSGSPFSRNDGKYTFGSETFLVSRTEPKGENADKYVPVNLPLYIGIGLRATAFIVALSGKSDISGIGAIGAQAEAKNLSGNLVVQTLGINGQSVAAALPVQSELNRTTAQNAVIAIGAIKPLIYEQSIVTPRVVGIYLPFPGGKPLVNAIISALSEQPVSWDCVLPVVEPIGILSPQLK